MRTHAHCIVINSFASPSAEELLIQQLTDIGCTNTIVARDCEHLAALSRGSTSAVIVFQLTEVSGCQTALPNIFDFVISLPSIGVFSQHNSFWCRRIAASSDEEVT